MTQGIDNMTRNQFKALARNTDGDIIGLDAAIELGLTDAQYDDLTNDDQSRFADIMDDLMFELALT